MYTSPGAKTHSPFAVSDNETGPSSRRPSPISKTAAPPPPAHAVGVRVWSYPIRAHTQNGNTLKRTIQGATASHSIHPGTMQLENGPGPTKSHARTKLHRKHQNTQTGNYFFGPSASEKN